MNRIQIIFVVLILFFGFLVVRQSKKGDIPEKAVSDYRQQPTQEPDAPRTYEVEIISDVTKLKPNEVSHITYKIKNDKGEMLKNFQIGHEKLMHLIVVREDLEYFQHVHPVFDSDKSEFTADITFITDGPYKLYADFTPAKFADNSKEKPFTAAVEVNVGNIKKYKALSQKISSEKLEVGEYGVEYELPSELKAKKELTYSLTIDKNGEPVTNLENYLGALGHSVVINTKSMQYIHTHAGEMKSEDHDSGHSDSSNTEGKINFSTTFPEAGIYKVFTEFKHDEKVMMGEYVLEVKN
jgi:hypothetical protein